MIHLAYTFDEHKIRTISAELQEAVKRLEEIASLSHEDFSQDTFKVAAAKYFLIVAIESAIDLCNHVISKNRLRPPEDYADTFLVMREEGFFPKEFAEKLMKRARFRNRLVHIYWKIDVDLLYMILQEDLADFERFLTFFSKKINS